MKNVIWIPNVLFDPGWRKKHISMIKLWCNKKKWIKIVFFYQIERNNDLCISLLYIYWHIQYNFHHINNFCKSFNFHQALAFTSVLTFSLTQWFQIWGSISLQRKVTFSHAINYKMWVQEKRITICENSLLNYT